MILRQTWHRRRHFLPYCRRFSSSNPVSCPAFKSLRKRIAVGSSANHTPKALKSYAETFAAVLRQCLHCRLTSLGRVLHAHAVKSGLASDFSVSTKLLTMYAGWGCLAERDRVFAEAECFDLFSWNFMLTAHVSAGDLPAARQLFDRMPERDVVTWTVMVDGHMKCGQVHEAMDYFERSPFQTVISFTATISGLVLNGLNLEALVLFRCMLEHGFVPNAVTFTSVLKACINQKEFDFGKGIVGLIVKTNFERNTSVCNSLITFSVRLGDADLARRVFDGMEERDVVSWTALLDVHAESGNLKEARCLFDEMPQKNEVSWSAMVARYAQNGEHLEALKLFEFMLRDGYKPNTSCFASVLSASASLENLLFGSSTHCHVLKVGVEGDVYVASSLIDMYCKCNMSSDGRSIFDLLPQRNIECWNSMIAGSCNDGKIEQAEKLFKTMPARNVVSWNAIISGYTQNNCFRKALETFDDMLISGQIPGPMTFSSTLHACANLSSLGKGKNLHGKIIKTRIESDVFIGTALTDMYAKSGDIESSKKVFSLMSKKNVISWTAMLQGLADNGLVEESIILFEGLKNSDITPTDPMFLCVLSACSHCGFLDKGFYYFESMVKDYGISPKEKHYTSMVDLLARAGCLREAFEFVSMMPIKPEPNSWVALLSACSTYQDEDMGERAAKKLLELEEGSTAGYILLSKIYATCGRWKDAAKVRKQMKNIGLKKGGGCSSIQIRDNFHTFFSWDASHPKSSEVYDILELVASDMFAWE